MTQSYYSVNGSPLQLILEDDVAEGYNRFLKAYFEAQQDYRELYGVQWTPDKELCINTSNADQEAFNAIAKLMNHLIKLNGGAIEITEKQMTSDYLVKLDV